MSKVRAWAEAQKEKGQREKPIEILSDAIIYGLSQFCIPEKDGKQKEGFISQTAKKVRIDYGGDASLFEIGCYLYFRIDLWHFRNKMEEQRDKVVDYLIEQFLLVFKNSLHLDNVGEILRNRLNLYGRLIRESKNPQEGIDFYLTQLLIRTNGNTPPVVCDFEDFPVLIIDVFEQTCLQIKIRAFEQGMVPACLTTVEKFYQVAQKTGNGF